jgi:RHS repeat-associated protein
VGTGYTQNWTGGNGGWDPFAGTLDEVAVYASALTAGRVSAHFTAGAGYRTAVLADSPAAYYRLDDGSPGPAAAPSTLADASGHGASASWSGGVVFGSPGLVGGLGGASVGVGGGSTYVQVPSQVFGAYPTSGSTTSYSLTFESWFQTTSGGVILGQTAGTLPPGTPSGGSVPAIYVDTGGALRESLLYHSTANQNVAAGPYTDGRPHHVVATYSGGTDTLYVDGVQIGSLTSAAEFGYAASYDYVLGNGYTSSFWPNTPSGAGWYAFRGSLDEVAVYASALPAARVQAHFTAGGNYRSAVLADAPAAYYEVDDAGPLRAADAGYGLWPLTRTDANGQTTVTSYDALGRQTSKTLPGESAGLTTTTTTYTVWCAAGAQTPCVEVDQSQRLNSTTVATSRAFYDGLGHLVETRSPAPGGKDVVRYSVYDASQRLAFQSVLYLVAAYSGPPGSSAYSTPDSTQPGTIYDEFQNGVWYGRYDALGRLLVSTDALSHTSTTTYSVVCAPAGTGDPGCFEETLSVDPDGHRGGTLLDGLGRKAYVQRYTGNSGSTYALYATAKYTYDFVGNLVKIVQPDGSTTTTFGYDMAGRKASISDPDLGQQTYTYDQDGNLTESVDARGGSGTIFMGYDGLDRPIWRNTSNSPTGAYDTYSYDSTAGGNVGIGRLTGETFATGSLSGGETYTYDPRGQQTNSTMTVGGGSYPLGSSYDDAGNVLTQTYPDGETITKSYTAQGWLSGVTTSQGNTTLASNLAYTGVGGAFGEITGASLGNGTYTYSATYDLLDRATDLKTTKTSGGTVMFDQSRTFDSAGNVTSIATTMPSATDNQSFCYDEQDRLTWASSATATPPCGGSNTAGTLTAALYTQTFSYDVLGRLTSGPLGAYTYGSSAHVHAASAIGTAWTAAYDAAGNMTCRAPSTSSTCSGTQTGAQLGYNNEGELQSWQNAPSSPSTTAQFLYDGQGQRVEQSLTQSGTATNTIYVGDLEDVSTTGGTTTTTAYYYAAGKRIGLSVNGTVSYVASDGLGSDVVTLNGSGAATAAQLFTPYGGVRYSSGSMPTAYGFTNQRSDSASGLDYYGARYYDPLAGQFISGDSLLPRAGLDLWGLSRYSYVEGNPENRVDPTGHINLSEGDNGSAVPIDDAFSGSYAWGSSPVVTYHRGFTRAYPASRSAIPASTGARSICGATPLCSAPPPAGNTQHESPSRGSVRLGGTLTGDGVITAFDGSDDSANTESGGSGAADGGAGIGASALAAFLRALAQAARAEQEGGQVLRAAANALRDALQATPQAVLAQLSTAEGDAAQSAPYLWRIFFGRALERAVAEDPAVEDLFQYVGQKAGPDFVLRATGSAWELTTNNAGTIAAHLARGVVDIGRLISYRSI